ncbi:WD40/YVTN/BNR-like repeat-containing protein [Mumia sp. DW29H23]|uniref:WD40/YVTN/BNR-like repeat-containing protein n=1 Tax=Mumia sp. DW29H23 TaxID=3421241 RepID=UPI003D6853C9
MDAMLLVGTRKGLWIGRSPDRRTWDLQGPLFPMNAVYSACIDTRGESARGGGPRLLVGTMSEHWGPQVSWSDDLGETWSETPGGGIRFPEDAGVALEQVWQLTPGAQPDEVWAGTQPSALFRSTDRGETFSFVRGLWDHPHRPHWEAGFGGQAIHTVVPDLADPDRVTVAMSTGGVYRTEDGGTTWDPHNVGIKAYFFPDPWPEYGQCVHKVASHPDKPQQMYAQNHHGVYRSDDGGDTWTSIADGLPSDFGFPIVVHPGRPDTVYVFPLVADGDRMPPDAQARVWRSDDAGETWRELGKGLPDTYYAAVMRDAFRADDATAYGLPAGLYLGGRDGSVFASADEGETWSEVATHLPDVMCVRAAMV